MKRLVGCCFRAPGLLLTHHPNQMLLSGRDLAFAPQSTHFSFWGINWGPPTTHWIFLPTSSPPYGCSARRRAQSELEMAPIVLVNIRNSKTGKTDLIWARWMLRGHRGWRILAAGTVLHPGAAAMAPLCAQVSLYLPLNNYVDSIGTHNVYWMVLGGMVLAYTVSRALTAQLLMLFMFSLLMWLASSNWIEL
ncbi:hypothetical protein DFH07DRAFT_772217 [Mycena maculata]|uniref:Uncharacterized protein n=1 Tax=Mycena maculata TaxID=230809 RepID=A0AAD7NG61_9AGAR|nr:hypothetical protein DFH07DRAFT_772217 [Mycena maculata]